jgi:hypothetical protein
MSDDKPDLPNDAIPKNKVEAFLLAQKYLNRLPLSVQLGLAGIGLVVAFYFGAQLRKTLFDNQENLARTLAATIVSTAYPHRGVTAFLVADLDNKLASETHYNNPNLKVAVDEIKNEIEQLKTSAINNGFEANTVFNDLKLVVVNKPKLEQRDIDHTWTKAIISQTMKDKDAYLMIPAISLRQPKVGDNKLEGNELQQIVQNNPEVLFDFYVASKIDEKLSKLGNLPGQTPRIVQAYFISESGVILLRALPKSRSYDEAFPTNTLFMDRLYFWGAIDPDVFGPEKDNNGPLDYQTAPYIDLGGNGVVKTYSTRVELPNFRTGVICVDVALSNARGEIRERLEALGAQVNDASHVSGKKQLEGEPGTTYPKGFDWVNYQLNGQAQSRITGAIAFESDFQRPAEDAIVRFSIPIESVTSAKDTTVTKLLLVTFDFASIRNRIFGYAIGFVLGILLLVFVMWNLFWHYTRLKRDMNKVLENLSQVMHEAETPFAWLNEKNEFQKVNVSFLDVLGCKTDHELKTYAPTFKDLVTADTLPTYEAILAQSAQGEPTPKYRINLVKRNREVISVWVHGERIPYPTFGRRRSPHRFGVFLPSRAPATENAPQDVITDNSSNAMPIEPG